MISRRTPSAMAFFLCLCLALPPGVAGQAAESAGKITAVLPIVNVVHGPQQIPASLSQQVYWGDVVNTGHLARARVALNDGSVLSVGSDSNLEITKHDAAEQQTQLELNFGRVRANAAKLVKPKASFQIRTPTGVAGVVGTDFEISTEGDSTRVVVFEGKVIFCALVSEEKKKENEQAPGADQQAPTLQEPSDNDRDKTKRHVFIGPCIAVAAGAMSDVHFNSAPSQPVPATPMTVTEAVNATSPTGTGGAGAAGGAAGGAGGGISGATGAIAGVGAAVGAGVATAVVRSVSTTKTCAPPPPTGGAAPRANCVIVGSTGRVPGQKP
jgi:FecR protein